MRILLVPRIEVVGGYGSLTVIPTNFMKAGLRADATTFFYVCVHEDFASDKSWLLNYGLQEDEIERVELVPLSADIVGRHEVRTYQRRLEYSMGAALSEKRHRGIFDHVDVIVMDCFQSIPMIKALVGGTFSRGYTCDIPVVAHGYWNPTSEWPIAFNDYDHWASEAGLLLADQIVFGSNTERECHLGDFRRFLNPATIRKLTEKCMVIPLGCDTKSVPFSDSVRGNKPTIMWSGYITQDYVSCVPAMIKALVMGRVGRVIIHPIDFKKLKDAPPEFAEYEKMDEVEVVPLVPKEDYLRKLSEADIGIQILTDTYFTYGIRTMEMIAAGQIVITSKHFSKNLLWPEYPFLATERTALDNILRVCDFLEDKKKSSEFRRYMRMWAEQRHDSMVGMRDFNDVVLRIAHDAVAKHSGGKMGDRVCGVLEGRDTIMQEELESELKKYLGMFSRGFIRKCVLQCGWRDTGKAGSPVYERGED